MKIIVDMMGGDNAPLAVLEGTAQAVKEYGVQILGVGNEELVRRTAADNNIPLDGIELVNCTQVIEMCDEPARAIRTKKDSSIVVGLNMLKDGKGDAFVSAGSTGALHVGASLIVRTLRGVKRPALATMVPAKKQAYLLLDCGANVECRPEMLAAFAVMGSCYVNKVEGRRDPSVALANNGAEESKGTPMLKEAHQLLKTTPGIRFVGNIEPRDVPGGEVDVVVCDGFTGNVILKLTEGVAKMLLGMLKQMFLANLGGKLAYLLLDCGANVECRPEMLAAFAVMGSCYVNKVEGRRSPSVALANNGAEESKGTPMLKEAHQLLKTTPGIRFVGNIEPRDVPNGDVDVVVCDGFTGNVILKLTEGVARMLLGMLKEMFLKNLGGKLAFLLLKNSVSGLKHQMDSEEYGGAPFLGAKQPVIKAHGSSKAKGIKNAIRQAKICVENDLCGTMQTALDELNTATKE